MLKEGADWINRRAIAKGLIPRGLPRNNGFFQEHTSYPCIEVVDYNLLLKKIATNSRMLFDVCELVAFLLASLVHFLFSELIGTKEFIESDFSLMNFKYNLQHTLYITFCMEFHSSFKNDGI